MWLLVPILLTVHILVCLLLVLVVLMQLPRSEGLGAAFGGGVTENIFGAQTTHVLAKFTVWLGVAFFVLTLVLAIAYSHQSKLDGSSAINRELQAAPAPIVAPAVAPSATPVASPAAVVPATEATPGATAPTVAPAATPVVQPEAAAPAPSATP